MILVRWPDGTVVRARSWSVLLRKVRSLPWNRKYTSAATMRTELSRRAYVWSGAIVNPALPAPEYWRALAATGMLTLEEDGCQTVTQAR